MSSQQGVKPKKSALVRKATQEERTALQAMYSASRLDPVPQSFYGTSDIQSSSTTSHAPKAPSVIPPKKKEAIKKEPVITPLKLKPAVREQDDLPEEIQEVLNRLSPLFTKYREKQEENESSVPYQTDTRIYAPQTDKGFYKFVDESYKSFRLEDRIDGVFDKEACATLKEKKGDGTASQAFLYQEFVREYIRNASPYRGILVYHGLGSGKTCASVISAEALYGTSNKKIIVMTPASLQGNYIAEITKCGFKHYSIYNHWEPQSLISENGATYLYANTVMSLPSDYLKNVLRREDPARQVIWIPDFSKPSNYNERTSQEQSDIREQIYKMITSRITFINYNSPNMVRKLVEIACTKDENGDRLFDNAVIVIDEIHNIVRSMQGTIDKYLITKQQKVQPGGKPARAKISSYFEEVVPGRWQPKNCADPSRYKRSFLLYRLLSDARNSKIIGLSGTPLINFPEELGILSNLLGGYMECVEFTMNKTDEDTLQKVRQIAEAEPRIDIVRYLAYELRTKVLLSVFQEGYIRAPTQSEANGYVGVTYDEDAQEGIQVVFERIAEKLKSLGVIIQEQKYVSYPRLPFDADTFREKFIDPNNFNIINEIALKKRLTGLVSYYKEKTEYMPRIAKDEFGMPIDKIVECEMSDHALGVYVSARKFEMALEMDKPKSQQDAGDDNALLAQFAKQKDSSNYRFRSRASCNFAFPKGIVRPHMSTIRREAKKGLSQEEIDSGVTDIQDIYDEAPQGATQEDEEAKNAIKEEELNEEDDLDAVAAMPSTAEEEKYVGGYLDADEPYEDTDEYDDMEDEEEQEDDDEDMDEYEDEDTDVVEEEDTDVVEEDDMDEEEDEEEDMDEEDDEMIGGAGEDESKANDKEKKLLERRAARLAAAASSSTPASSAAVSSTPLDSVAASSVAASSVAASSVAPSSVATEPKPKRIVSRAVKKNNAAPAAASVSSVPISEPIASLSASSVVPSSVVPSSVAPTTEPKPKRIVSRAVKKNNSVAASASSVPPSEPISAVAASSVATEPKPKRIVVRAVKKNASATAATAASVPITKSIREDEKVPLQSSLLQKKTDVDEIKDDPAEYIRRLQQCMQQLDQQREKYLKLDAVDPVGQLSTYSSKLDKILRNMEKSKGSNLVYSQFKTVEGLGVLGIALKANGYTEIRIEGTDNDPEFSKETKESLLKGPDAKEKRFILFTGEGSKEKRDMILNLFNGKIDQLKPKLQTVLKQAQYVNNNHGEICWTIAITGAGAEGISLRCCRSVHIMEPYWNNVRLDQVKGRAIRICSHEDLPYEEREVEIYTYYSVFSRKQLQTPEAIDVSVREIDKNITSDQRVLNISRRKDTINNAMLQIMKESAVDCFLNAADNEALQCFRLPQTIMDRPDVYMFDPNLEVDIEITNRLFPKHKLLPVEEKKADSAAASAAAASSASTVSGVTAASSSLVKGKVEKFRYKSVPYSAYPKPGSGGMVYLIYADNDTRTMSRPLGEGEQDPMASTFRLRNIFFYESKVAM